jgi:MFS family permease
MPVARSVGPLYAAAGIRSFVTGLTGVLLGLYLGQAGLGAVDLGMVVGAGLGGLAGGTAVVAWWGDRLGRRRVLVVSTLLGAAGLAGVALLEAVPLLAMAAFAGMVNGMGRDRGPAQTLEQSVLADAVSLDGRITAFTRYALAQDVAGALGSLAAAVPSLLQAVGGLGPLVAYRWTLLGAAAISLVPAMLYSRVAPATPGVVSAGPSSPGSRRRIAGLAGLFALDSVGGGFLAGSILTYWFFRRFGVGGEVLGPVFFAARGLNALSYVGAAWLARRIGLIRTMVFTHLPSSILLLALPLVPGAPWAIALFLAREALVQMDVPTRQSYVASVVPPNQRTFALGVTGVVRNVGWAVGPAAAGFAMGGFGIGAPLVLGAGLKIVYDLVLFASFRGVRPPGDAT